MAGTKQKQGKIPRVVGFYGLSASGKTTLIERVLRALREHNLQAAVIKQSRHAPEVDTPGKDTWRFAQAGANPIVFHAQEESVLFLPGGKTVKDLIEMLAAMGQDRPDIILVEGARDEEIPKVRVGEIEERPYTVMDYMGDFEALLNLILEGEEK